MLWNYQPERYAAASELELRIGHVFDNRALLYEALTHRSALAGESQVGIDQMKLRPWNERLEFLGDSVIGLVVSEHLMRSGLTLTEGEMSRVRAGIVCEQNLAKIASERLELGGYLVLSPGERASGGQAKPAILADAMEAVIGAIFMDAGWDKARQTAHRLFHEELSGELSSFLEIDAKTELQERSQAMLRQAPVYEVVAESGPAHDRHFDVVVRLNGKIVGHGDGKSKKTATQNAAREALRHFEESKI